MTTKLVRTTIALLTGLTLVAGCGAQSTPHPTAAAAETVAPRKAPAAPYARKGAYDVGSTTLKLDDGRRVVVWYPAAPGRHPAEDRERVDPWPAFRPDLLDEVPANERSTYLVDAYRNIPAAHLDRRAPLVVYSHGYSGFPENSVSLTTHLASWGFVVAAPEHVEHSLGGLYGTGAKGMAPQSDAAVLGATVDEVHAASNRPGTLNDLVDPDRVSAIGFSAGSISAYQFAADDRVDGFIAYGVRFGDAFGPQPPAPAKPGMVMEAEEDDAVPNRFTEKAYAAMADPKYLVKVYDAGHEVFGDACLFGAPKHPFVEVAREHQVLPDWLTTMAADGCQRSLPPVTKAQPAIFQASVAFLRWVNGIDAEPVGLSTAAVARLGTPTTITKD